MSWNFVEFLEELEIINEGVQSFVGERFYMATGDLSNDDTHELESVSYQNKPSRAALTAQPGDVIFARMKGTNKVLLITEKETNYIFSTGFVVLRSSEKVDESFLTHYLKSSLFQDEKDKLCTGATQKSINNQNIQKLKFPLPPLAAQKRIAEILDAADALRRKDQELLKKYDELAQAIFIDMFGDPVKNEKGWDEKLFGELISYIGDIGSNGSNEVVAKNLKMLDNEDYAIMIRTTNLAANDFVRNMKYISEDTYNFFKKSKIYGGEIIMNKIGSAGHFWIMPKLHKPVSLGLNQLVIRLNDLNTLYLFYYLSTPFGKQIVKQSLNGAVTKSITKGAVKNLPILYPPIILQEEFARRISQIENIKKSATLTLDGSETLFSSLIQKAFKGELVA
jgi:type I restriction enzyme S subunit